MRSIYSVPTIKSFPLLTYKQARELRWLLTSLQESLGSLKDGLEECVQILKPDSTLVLSSLRSEVVKGWVRREGGGITKGVSAWPLIPSGFTRIMETGMIFRRLGR